MTIIETGSFQKATMQLNYAPSTVTAQTRQLEKDFSLVLFEKIERKMKLTPAGMEIQPFVKNILQNVEQITNYKKDLSEITGTLRLVAPDSIFIYIIQPIIQTILHSAPNVQLIVNSLPSDDINHYAPSFSVVDELKNGSLLQLNTELDGNVYPAVCVFHRNKWISPQMELAFKILHEQLRIDFSSFVTPKVSSS